MGYDGKGQHPIKDVNDIASLNINFDSTQVLNVYNFISPLVKVDFEKIKGHTLITVVGHAVDSSRGNQLITGLGQQIPLTAQGWKNFEPSP